jgi:hypothetical protein
VSTKTMGLAVLLGFAALGSGMWLLLPREYLPCGSCAETGSLSCGAPGCNNGRVPCPGSCLKKEDPGWQVRNLPNLPPDELLLELRNNDGTSQFVSQRHLGQTVEMVGARWVLGGPCPRCDGGATRPLCPSCQGKKKCPSCGGKGKIRK